MPSYLDSSFLYRHENAPFLPFPETNNLVFYFCPSPQALPLQKLSITEKVVQAVQSMLLPQEGSLSIHTSLPATGDGSTPVMAVVRLLAEIRTRWVEMPDPTGAVWVLSRSGVLSQGLSPSLLAWSTWLT